MIYEVTLFQTYQGQSCVNRWNYLMTGTPASIQGSFGLIEAMGAVPIPVVGGFPADTIMAVLRNMQDDGVMFQAISAKAIYDVTDFYELPYVPVIPGMIGGEGAAPFVAYGFRTNRTRTDIRRGTKRFVGVPETYTGDGGTVIGNGAIEANNLAAAMSEPITYDDEGNTLTYSPIVVSKQLYQVPDRDTEAYRYWPTLAEQMTHIAESVLWQPYQTVRSQTSRQYARGQ